MKRAKLLIMKKNKKKPVRAKKARLTRKKPKISRQESSLKDLYALILKDMYWAEKHLVKTLPRLAKASDNAELRKALEEHLVQTEGQVQRLEKVFTDCGIKPALEKCDAVEGLSLEGKEIIRKFPSGQVRDAG